MQKYVFGINNYKNIKRTKLNIIEKEINYILGSNESGKSNLIKAVEYFTRDRRAKGLKIETSKDYIKYNGIPREDLQIFFNINLPNNPDLEYKLDNELNIINDKDEKINFPYIRINNPILNSTKDFELKMKLSDLTDNENELNLAKSVFEAFKTPRLEDNLKNIIKFKNKNYDESTKQSHKRFLSEEFNKKLKSFFKSIKHISAYPQFNLENDIFTMSIENSKKYEIDDKNINQRSTGYKCFYKTFIETKSYAAFSTNDKPIIYIIDEPEQGLHPYLQLELFKNLKNIVENQNKNNNFTLVIITHSPFMLDNSNNNEKTKNINFCSRNKEGSLIIDCFDKLTVLKKYSERFKKNNTSENISEDDYLLNIIFNGFLFSNFKYLLNNNRLKLNFKLQAGKINETDYYAELTKIQDLENSWKNKEDKK